MVEIKQGLCNPSKYPKQEILDRKLHFLSKLSPLGFSGSWSTKDTGLQPSPREASPDWKGVMPGKYTCFSLSYHSLDSEGQIL